MAQSPKTRKMHVADGKRVQGLAERLAIELRIVARPWYGPYIDYPRNLVRPEQIDESADWPVRVPDRADERPIAVNRP